MLCIMALTEFDVYTKPISIHELNYKLEDCIIRVCSCETDFVF